MLMQKLKKEFELKYRIFSYKKLLKMYKYNKFEKNNYNIIYKALEDVKHDKSNKTIF